MSGRTISPWSHLNLRWNPFGEPPAAAVPGLIVLPDETALVDHVIRPRSALQFLGHAGRGKTARLRFMQHRFPGAPYVYLGEDEPIPHLPEVRPKIETEPALLLDEAQRLPRRRRLRLFDDVAAAGASIIIASHDDLSEEMTARRLEVKTVTVMGLDEDRLREIMERRLEWARHSPGPLPMISPEMTRKLIRDHGDDLRSLLDQLYEEYQQLLYEAAEETQWRNVI